ncbi:MAG: PadR family transcriptional regulator [Candidatus Hodarchaeales archaeon]|jgi:DNA-binding PadR family transcriptional regulator
MFDLTQWEAAFRKGFAKPIILQILHDEGESYPYKLTKQIPKRTMGMLTMATSNIYPILKTLKDDGLICEMSVKERKIMYGLTEQGKFFLKELKVSITEFMTIMLKNFD